MSQGSREPAGLSPSGFGAAQPRGVSDDFTPGEGLPAQGANWFDDDPGEPADLGRDAAGRPFDPYASRPARSMAEDLPRPMEVTGRSQRSVYDGQVAHTPPGRPTRVPMLSGMSNNPAVAQLHVMKRENGVPVSLGIVDAQITPDDFVRRFEGSMPLPGQPHVTFELRTLNDVGHELGQAWFQHIGADHAALQDLRATRAAAMQAGAPGGYRAPPAPDLSEKVFGLLSTVLTRNEADLRREAEEERRRNEAALAGQLTLAQQSSMGLTDAYGKMIELDQQRQSVLMERTLGQLEHGHQQTTGFMNTMLAQQAAQREADRLAAAEERRSSEQRHKEEMERLRFQAAQDREATRVRAEEEARVREELRRERELQAAEMNRLAEKRLEAEKERLRQDREDAREEARRKDAERDAEYRRKEAQAQRDHDAALARLKIEAEERQRNEDRKAEMEREHQKRLRELELEKIKHLDGQTNTLGFGAALGPLAGLLKTIGLDPKEVAQRALGIGGEPEEQPSQTVEVLKALAPVAGGVINAAMQAWALSKGVQAPNRAARRGNRGRGGRGRGGRGGPAYPGLQQAQVGVAPDEDDDEDDDYEDDDDDDSEADVPAPAPRRPVFQPGPGVQQRAIGEGLPAQAPVPTQAQPTTAVMPLGAAPQAAPAGAAPAAAQAVDPSAALSPVQMAAARRAAAELVEALQDSAPEGWEGIVFAALTAQPLIYELIQRQGLRLVVLNAGGDVGLFTRLRDMLRANALVPGDLNYGE